MTKIWCPICHKSEFDVYPPTQRTLMNHVQEAHKYSTSHSYLLKRERLRKRQNQEWDNHCSELGEKLDANAKQIRRQYEDFTDDPIRLEVPVVTTNQELQQQWMQLMEVYDDSEGEGNEVAMSPDHDTQVDAHCLQRAKTAPRSAKQRYPTIADRTTQAATIVERATVSSLRQSMLVPAASRDVGWDTMAGTGFTPAGAQELREDRHGMIDGRDRFPTHLNGLNGGVWDIPTQSEGETQDAVDAAHILLSMSTSQIAQARTHIDNADVQIRPEMKAAMALEELYRGFED